MENSKCFKTLPNGFYWFQTNPNAKTRWLSTKEIKVIKEISDDKVSALCRTHGVKPQSREC